MRAIVVAALVFSSACDSMPGRPTAAERYVRPSEVKDFTVLYGENCSGCHGDAERPGAAVALSDPVYLAVADDGAIRRTTALGVAGTAMPGFSRGAGGPLTDGQIDVLVRDMRARWAKPGVVTAAPHYAAPPGDAGRGARSYATYCASCHGPDGTGGPRGGSVVDGSYLALVSDQALRTAVIVGRPRLGMPDWRGYVEGRPMSADEISDVVAWLAAKRPSLPGMAGGHPSSGKQ